MKNNNYIKLNVIFFFILFFGCDNGVQSSPPPIPRISLSTSQSSILVGESLTLNVHVAHIEDLSYITFEIEFDPLYLEVEMNEGEMNYSTFTNNNFGPIMYLDTLGVLSVAFGSDSINGDIIPPVTINGLLPGTTKLELNKVNLRDANRVIVDNLNNLILRDVTIIVTDE